MRTTLLLDFLAYDAVNPTNDPADSIQVKKRVEEGSAKSVSRLFPLVMEAAESDREIELPASNCDYLILLTDQEISIKLNGGEETLNLKPRAAGVKTPVFLLRGEVTGLIVSNLSDKAANLDITFVDV